MLRSIAKRIALSVALSGLLLVTARCGAADTPTGQGAVRQTSANYPAPATPTANNAQALAAGPYPPPGPREMTRTAIALNELHDVQTAIARPPAPKAQIAQLVATPGPSPTPYTPFSTPLAGGGTLVMSEQTPFSSHELVGENEWFIDVAAADTRYVVFAGKHLTEGVRQSPEQGALVVQVVTISTGVYLSTTLYLTPARTGSAHIVDAKVTDAAMLLTVETADATRYMFDVRSGKFLTK